MKEKHGMSYSPEYSAWKKIKLRCTKQNYHCYNNYGGRGITVCERWLYSFGNFYADMGPRPEGRSIDRIDNDKGYYKENCRWANKKQQQNNRRANVNVKYMGVTKTRQEWSEYLGVGHECLRARLNRGWSIERAMGSPVKTK